MYKIIFDQRVRDEDLKSLSKKDQYEILQAIYKKLSLNPFYFGKPLREPLQGFFRLRVTKYRVIYKIYKDEVTVEVIKIGLRKDFIVYAETMKRIDG
jgi:mRNA-degrading endonuclease RelE of RelBE toxin-antitoxin system